MRTFSRTSQFKKDIKRLNNRGKEMAKLKNVLENRLPRSTKKAAEE